MEFIQVLMSNLAGQKISSTTTHTHTHTPSLRIKVQVIVAVILIISTRCLGTERERFSDKRDEQREQIAGNKHKVFEEKCNVEESGAWRIVAESEIAERQVSKTMHHKKYGTIERTVLAVQQYWR